MKKIFIILGAVGYNRGSEALTRGLVNICKQTSIDSQIYLSSNEQNLNKICKIPCIHKIINKYTDIFFIHIISAFLKKFLLLKTLSVKIKSSTLLKYAKKMDLIIIIGADNYDKSYGMTNTLYNLNKTLKKVSKAKMLLYDVSLDKSHIDKHIINDFNMFNHITVREHETLNNLKNLLPINKISYYPDPAFTMKPEECPIQNYIQTDNTVGINLSPLITRKCYNAKPQIILNAYFKLIDFIIKNTDMSVVLIPHVMNGEDLSILRMIYNKYTNDTGRLKIVDNEDLTAPQLKYVISQCRLFIGARTHATIAAYSSCIPTLVLGYSIKSIGIAKDLFGTDKNYVIPVDKLKDNQLSEGFNWLYKHEKEIKNILNTVMPDYIKKAESTSELIKKLLQ